MGEIMDEQPGVLGANEVAVVPIDVERGLGLALGYDLKEAGDDIARGLMTSALRTGGLLGGAMAAKPLLDGTLVRLAPETVKRMREGAVFVKDAQGLALGTLRGPSGFTDAVRFLPPATNPMAAGLLLQTMALQAQLGRIEAALEDVQTKLASLLKSHHHGVLADLLAIAAPVDELVLKLQHGHELTQADEIKLRDYEDRARTHQLEAELWLTRLRELLAQDDLGLQEQLAVLESLMRDEHVAFWVRVYLASQLSLARVRWLRLTRAAVEDPGWAQTLQGEVTTQLDQVARGALGLAADLDAYLRRHDIARGFEELSFTKKFRVRRLRREMCDVHEQLRRGLSSSERQLRSMLVDDDFVIPDELTRREIEPRPVRDFLTDASRTSVSQTAELSRRTGDVTLRAADRLLRELDERAATRREAAALETDESTDS